MAEPIFPNSTPTPNIVDATAASATTTQGIAGSANDQTIQQCIHCLKAKDDTTQFVGLTLLLPILRHTQDKRTSKRLWDSINPTFLDRMLKAGSNKTPPSKEDKQMVELAVSVIRAFAAVIQLASEMPSMVGRTPPLVETIPKCSNETAAVIVETLSIFATGERGARAILTDYMPLVYASATQEGALPVITQAAVKLMNGGDGDTDLKIMKVLEVILPKLSRVMAEAERTHRSRVLSFLGDLFPRIPIAFLPSDQEWVIALYSSIRKITTSTHNQEERAHIAIITATLLNAFPSHFLFIPRDPMPTKNGKPFTYFFIQLLLIDIRSTIPALLEQLASPNYATITQRLAADYDIISAFIAHLVMIESLESIDMDASQLLKLKWEITETFSITLEFLRDRWDSAYAGAAGLEAGHRESGALLNLTWDVKIIDGGATRDPLVISAVRALSLWLREDESLREDAGGLMDLFLGLWKTSTETDVDYRQWIVGALEGVVTEANGRAQFLQMGGWELLWGGFSGIYADSERCEEDELQLALEILRVLVEIVRMSSYMEILLLENKFSEVARIARITKTENHGDLWLDMDISTFQLGAEIWKRLPEGSKKRVKDGANKLCELCDRLSGILRAKSGGNDSVEKQEDVVYSLAEVMKEFGMV